MDEMITLDSEQYGCYLIRSDDGKDLLVQVDWDFPGVAATFGWVGEDDDIAGAQRFLDRIADEDKWVEDPGYFG